VSEPSSRLWSFSLAVYGDAAVQAECIDLQERHAIDVNLLLFCIYVGAVLRAVLPDAELREAASLVNDWHKHIVRSLREARRALKLFAVDSSLIGSSAARLRTGVKAAELEGERIEQAMLEEWSALRVDGWLRAEPAEAVDANIRSLFAICCGSAGQPEMPHHLVAAALAAARPTGA
jgi:uncharacterized protein (TIGR02444 family)